MSSHSRWPVCSWCWSRSSAIARGGRPASRRRSASGNAARSLVAHGKMGDATLTEVREDHLFYAYLVRGVEYTASQDVSLLKQYMPPDLSQLAAVSVRYDPRNPANSIVLAEQWTGLHFVEPKKQG